MHKMRSFTSIIIILILLINGLFALFTNKSYALTQNVSSDIDSINDNEYPGFKELIKRLQRQYPNWKFKVYYTDLDWNTVIANEYTGHNSSPRNLIQPVGNYTGEWICSICGNKAYDNGSWHCASEKAIKYMMDPRNSLNVIDIFQFEEITNNGYDVNSVNAMIKGTFLDGHANGIINAAEKNNINPYYIVARLLQEQGRSGSVLVRGTGYSGQYAGYYNAFNIGAYGGSSSKVILNGLSYASKVGWTSLDASIDGGINFLANEYIRKGQNTLYLQKFDVDNSDGSLYWHQYMQNLLAAQTEGTTLRTTYDSINSISIAHSFIIPLYKNMPKFACARPNSPDNNDNISKTDIVKVNVDGSLRLRNAPNGSTTVGWLWKNEYVTRVEVATSKVNGTYWDKVMKSDGTIGYAARQTYDSESNYKLYLMPIEDNNETNSNNKNSNENTSSNANQTNDNNKQDSLVNQDYKSTDKVKIDEKNNIITVTPDAIAKDILDAFGGSVKIVKADDSYLNEGLDTVGTGYKVQDKYTVVKKGDCNGDGKITAGDYVLIKNHIMEISSLNEIMRKGSDYNEDGKITAGDYVLIKNYIMKK